MICTPYKIYNTNRPKKEYKYRTVLFEEGDSGVYNQPGIFRMMSNKKNYERTSQKDRFIRTPDYVYSIWYKYMFNKYGVLSKRCEVMCV